MSANRATARYTMYGAEFSLYSGKLRSYLRKKGIAFDERTSTLMTYRRFIVPRTGVRYIPVLHTPDDEVLQDTTAIIDRLERVHPEPDAYPPTPRQHLAALLLELYGDEWLLIPAMHYRWNFPADNQPFIFDEFGRTALPWAPRPMRRWVGRRLGTRFAAFLPALGIDERTSAGIESSYLELLAALDAHFANHDFVFGGRPTIADFGLIGPLYAHLYRDPRPGALMRERAPRVVAWVERMMSPDPADGHLIADDEIPDTLRPVLQRMAREQVPVLVDTEWKLTEWHRANPDRVEIPRALGEHAFEIGGTMGRRRVLPRALWRWQRPRDYYQGLEPSARAAAAELGRELGLRLALAARPRVRVGRRHNRFVIET
jgi:glutathione S-transferase